MKIKTLYDGNNGTEHVPAGTTYDKDGEWARRMLINGMAEPLDDEAKKIAADKEQQDRYASEALRSSVAEDARVVKRK